MSLLSKRLQYMDSSGIRKVFDLGASLDNPIDLSIGQPHFDVFPEIKEEAIRAIQNGHNSYTVTQGIPELHQAVREYYRRRFDIEVDHTLITSGVSGGLVLSFMALINPGDEVIVSDPCFMMYPSLVGFMGGVVKRVDTYPNFRFRADKLEAAVTSKSKVLVINTPANPTGAVIPPEDLQMIADFADSHGLFILTDEIYEQFSFDSPPDTILNYSRPERTMVLNGLSKSAGMTGWRVGYAIGPEEVLQAMTMLQQYSFVCAPSFAQRAGLVALRRDMAGELAEYRSKRDLMYEGLCERGFEVQKPGGAFYIFPKAPGGSGTEFVERAIANNLLIIPGNVFSTQDSHCRISLAAEDEKLRQGLEVLGRVREEFEG